MKRSRDRAALAALPLLEEAVHLLRQAESTAWLIYGLGLVPFCLGVLWFWSSLRRPEIGPEELAGKAFVLAVLYLLMKTAQAEFCRRLLAARLRLPVEPRDRRGWLRLAAAQLRLQPWALGACWAGAATLAAFPWALAYGQNLSVLGDEPSARREAAAQTWVAPSGNIVGVLCLLAVFIAIWLNTFAACLVVPWAADRLLGLDSAYSRTGLNFFNSSVFAASLILAWAAFDPLLKAFYTLRIFHGRALRTGDDLRVDWRRARAAVRLVPWALLLVVPGLRAEEAEPAVDGAQLNHAIDATLAQPEYAWHRPLPPAEAPAPPAGLVGRILSDLYDGVRSALRAVRDFFERLWNWFFPSHPSGSSASAASGHPVSPVILYLLPAAAGVALIGLLLLLAAQAWEKRTSRATAGGGAPVEAPPNLAAEGIDASRLPSAGWRDLARELAGRGEWRLAVRAAYLATLAELAARDLIRLARAKTNLDYERELRRRAAARAEIVEPFVRRRSQFEAVWYGAAAAAPGEVLAWIAELDGKGPA